MKTNNKDYMFWLSFVTALVVVFVSVAAFVLSFGALESIADNNGLQRPFSYLFPLIIDLAMIAFSLSAFRSTLAGERVWWAWALIIMFTAVSMTLNGLHANEITMQGDAINWVAIAIAAIAPLVVLLTFETFMKQIATSVKSNIGRLQSTIAKLKSTIEKLKSEVTDRDETIIALQSRIDHLQTRSDELTQVKRIITQLEKQNELLKSAPKVPIRVGPFGVDLLSVVQGDMTAKRFCEIHEGVSESWVSRTKSLMNHGENNE